MIDLHTHSTASDGTDSPGELVKKAHKQGIQVLALTDHDTLDGLVEAEECARDLSIDFIRGCELSTRTRDDRGNIQKLHILGLWIPKECAGLERFLDKVREIRDERNLKILGKLQGLGIKLELEELRMKGGDVPGRPHFAQLLVEKGYTRSIKEAFDKYLSSAGKAYVPKESFSPEVAIDILARQGAMVFIAHPMLGTDAGKGSRHFPWLERMLPSWRSLGLSGLEAWNSAHNKEQTGYVMDLAARNSLEISGGSDYHGTVKENARLGYAMENQPIPDSIYKRLKELKSQQSTQKH